MVVQRMGQYVEKVGVRVDEIGVVTPNRKKCTLSG